MLVARVGRALKSPATEQKTVFAQVLLKRQGRERHYRQERAQHDSTERPALVHSNQGRHDPVAQEHGAVKSTDCREKRWRQANQGSKGQSAKQKRPGERLAESEGLKCPLRARKNLATGLVGHN